MTSDLIAVGESAALVPSATSDDAMVEIWLGKYRRSIHTRRGYEADAKAFRRFTAKPLHAVTGSDIAAFADSLENLAPATQARRLSAVKSMFAMLRRQGYLPFDVAAAMQMPVIKDTLTERIMSEDVVQHLLWTADTPARFGRLSGSRTTRFTKRNAALLRLLYGSGLRISEACKLKWRDITPRDDAAQLNILGKGGKTRPVLLTKSLWDRISALRGNAGPDDPVFRSRESGALNPSQAHRIMKEAAERAKLPAEASAHWLRHAHASHALDRGCPVHVVQSTLGHASLTTTTRYSHVRPGDSSAKYLVA